MFDELLLKRRECTIHQNNLQKLMLEVYHSLLKQNPSLLWDMFQKEDNNHDLSATDLLMLPQTKTTAYGNDHMSFCGSIFLNSIPNDNKVANSVCSFKTNTQNGMLRPAAAIFVNRC